MYEQPTYFGGQDLTATVNSAMKRVYVKMFLGLLITALTAWFAATSGAYMNFFSAHTWFIWVLVAAELGIVFAFSGALTKLSNGVASLLFYIFAIVNGLMLCTIFYAYSPLVIFKTFLITSATFGAMSIYGYFTNRDLSKIGNYFIYALFGLLITMVVNIFLKSNGLDWLISIVGVFLFIGLTAWDTQQVKRLAAVVPSDMVERLATLGALNLYLDFINLFLFLLRIFGGNRD